MADLIKSIVNDIGGTITDGGRGALCPGPGHSERDRSMSIKIGRGGRLIVNSFSPATTWQECRDFLRERGHIEGFQAKSTFKRRPVSPEPLDSNKIEAAKALWAKGTPIRGTIGENYIRLRKLPEELIDNGALRFARMVDHYPYGNSRPPFNYSPAILAKISDQNGYVIGVHITYLNAKTGFRRVHEPTRKMIGYHKGYSVKLNDFATSVVTGEGWETTASAAKIFGMPAMPLLSAANISAWEPDSHSKLRFVFNAVDNNAAGENANNSLTLRLMKKRIRVVPLFPPARFKDWNDVLTNSISDQK